MRQFMKLLRGEVWRMVARKRTHIGFGVFVGFEIVLLFFMHTEKFRRWYQAVLELNGHSFEEYYSALTMAFFVMNMTVFILGALFLSLVSGDIVAKELEDGALRMVLSRPVTRFRLLAVKFLACFIYTLWLMFFIGGSALMVGFIDRGWGGGMFVWVPVQHVFEVMPFWEGLCRYAAAVVFLALSMQTVSALGFCLSCQKMKPAAATILTVSILFTDFILCNIPALSSYRHLFLVPRMDNWMMMFREHVPWPLVIKDYSLILGVQATCFVAGWIGFQGRDLKA